MTRKPLLLLALLLTAPLFAQNADVRVSAETHLFDDVTIGEIVPLHITVDNEGPDVAKNVRATVTVPAGMAVVHTFVTPPYAGTCTDTGGQTVTCTFGDLAAVERGVRVSVRMPAAVGTFGVTTTVASDTPDSNPDNNVATTPIRTANRTNYWVYLNPVFSRVDPGEAVTIEARLTNSPATLIGTRFFLHFAAENGTIEAIDAPGWQCSVSGDRAECVLSAPTTSCCVDLPLSITLRTNPDPAGGETRMTIDASSDVPGGFFEQAWAVVRTWRHIVVSSTADAGPGTLRAAFDDVNANCAETPCKIDFALPAPVPAEGWFTIVPETPLPVLRARRVYVDAATQTTLTGDTNPNGPEVAIDGRNAGRGLEIHAECGALVRGFALGNFHANEALWLTRDRRACSDATYEIQDLFEIAQNHVGVDPSGTTPWPNRRGLVLDDGGGVRVAGNIISSNTFSGVWMWRGAASFHGNRIERNGASGIFFGPEVQYGEVLGNAINWHRDMGVAVARGAHQIDIRRNSMRGNVGLGIDWGLDGPTPPAADDSGLPSNPPVLLSAVYDAAADETVVTMTLRSKPLAQYFNAWVINVYANDAPDGDGEQHLAEQQFHSVPEGPLVLRVRGDHTGKWLNATSSRVHFIVFSRPGEPRTESFGGGQTLTSELSNTVLVTR